LSTRSYTESADKKQIPSFLITIDTEGDNLWERPHAIETKNAEFLPRFQELCESFKFKPIYLTNYEMAISPQFQEFGHDIIKRNTGEIGMHLHAWNSPPLFNLTGNDFKYTPYLIEYPKDVIQQKVSFMTALLEDTFQVKIISHRAGRWSFNEIYAQVLEDAGYLVDCSVTPHVSWEKHIGDPKGNGGTDYSQFPDEAYFLDLKNIAKAGNSKLLEVPMTIYPKWVLVTSLCKHMSNYSLPKRVLNYFFPSSLWLRPGKNNIKEMLRLVKQGVKQKKNYLEFMLHSSELMPGGSPTFQTKVDIDLLYRHLELFFTQVSKEFLGTTFADFYENFISQ
jgi:hypothetical protein